MEMEKTDDKRIGEIQRLLGEMIELNNMTPDECIKSFASGLCSTCHTMNIDYESFSAYLDKLKVLYKQRDSEPESK